MRCVGLDRSECYGFANTGDSGLCDHCKHKRALNLLRELACYAPPVGQSAHKVPVGLLRKVASHVATVDSDKKVQEEVNEAAKLHKKEQEDDLAAGRAVRLAGVFGLRDAPHVLPSVGGTMLGEPSKGNK